MDYNFSIEISIDKIQNAKTKEYFQEVYQTFVNGNYRSSIVILYSVLICDLIYKLRDLRDIYADATAKSILNEIEIIQSTNPKSPEWETKLIESIKTRTSLLEPSDAVSIESLQKYRHLSAHPVLTNSDLLYSPDKYTVLSLIRNILNGVLTNPPFFSNKIFDALLKDLDEVKNKITEFEKLEKYLKSRYIKQLKDSDYKKIFRSLWKIVFITADTKSDENRQINYDALKTFIKNKKDLCLQLIKNESSYYNNISRDNPLSFLAVLISEFPEIHKSIETSLDLLLLGHINKYDDLKLISWFYHSNIKEHLEKLRLENSISVSVDYVNYLKSVSIQNEYKNEFIDFIIRYFGESSTFEMTLQRYNNCLVSIEDELNLDQTIKLLKISNENNQIYNRISIPRKLQIIASKYEKDIDKSLYNNIFNSI